MGKGYHKDLKNPDGADDFKFLYSLVKEYAPLTFSEERYYFVRSKGLPYPTIEEIIYDIKPKKPTAKEIEAARSVCISHNLRLVIAHALSKSKFHSMNAMHLIESGIEGLIRAVDKFDINRKNPEGHAIKFSTYAMWWVDCCIRKEQVKQRNHYRIGRSKLGQQFDRAKKALRKVFKRPTFDEIVAYLAWDESIVRAYKSGGDYIYTSPIDAFSDEDKEHEPAMYYSYDPGEDMLEKEKLQILEDSINILDNLQATILVFHNGLFSIQPMTYKKLALILNIPEVIIKTNHRIAMKKLYRWLRLEHGDTFDEYV